MPRKKTAVTQRWAEGWDIPKSPKGVISASVRQALEKRRKCYAEHGWGEPRDPNGFVPGRGKALQAIYLERRMVLDYLELGDDELLRSFLLTLIDAAPFFVHRRAREFILAVISGELAPPRGKHTTSRTDSRNLLAIRLRWESLRRDASLTPAQLADLHLRTINNRFPTLKPLTRAAVRKWYGSTGYLARAYPELWETDTQRDIDEKNATAWKELAAV